MAFYSFIQNTGFNSGWYPSAVNYDMCASNPWNSMNLFFNQAWADLGARQNLYNVQAYDLSNSYLYGNINYNSHLIDPRFTLGQMNWQNMQNGMPNMFGTDGSFNAPWSNTNWNNNPWGGNWGWNGGSTSGNSGSTPQTPEERDAQRKYNKLLTVIKELKKYDKLTDSQKTELTELAKGLNKGTWEERFEALKEGFDKISNEDVKDFLAQSTTLKIGDEDGNFYQELLGTGYEHKDTVVDENIEALRDNIEKLADNNGNIESDKIAGSVGSSLDILDVISSWNSKYHNENIIDHIATYYNDIDSENSKDTARNTALKPFVTALTQKANTLLKGLNDSQKANLEKAIKNLEDAYRLTNDKIEQTLIDAFDELYLQTRLAASEKVAGKIANHYEGIDDEIFNKEIFVDDTKADLKEEGFTDEEINNRSVGAQESAIKVATETAAKDGAKTEAMKTILDAVNQDNVIDFIEGYYAGDSDDDIIDDLNSKELHTELKKFLQALLSKANELKVEKGEGTAYKRIESILREYKTGDKDDKKKFEKDDRKALETAVKELYEAIKTKLA